MEAPPQVLKQQVRELAASQDLQSLKSGAALETFGARLPVLQAFHEFIEIERRQARRRLVALAAVFLVLLLVVLAGAVLVNLRFAGRVNAQVRNLETALALARSDTMALRGDAEAMQKAIAAAEQALADLRGQLASAVPAAVPEPPPEIPHLAAALGLLQEVHRLRSDQLELGVRQTSLQNDLRKLEAERSEMSARQDRLRAERADLESAIRGFAGRQKDLDERLGNLRTTKTRRGESTDAAALALLQEIHRLRTDQPDLIARQAALSANLEQLESGRKALAQRQDILVTERQQLAQAVEALRSRQQDLQTRLASVR